MQAGCFEVTQSSLLSPMLHYIRLLQKDFFRMFDVFSQNIEDRIVFLHVFVSIKASTFFLKSLAALQRLHSM
jgi:hypothetical protein